MVEATKKHPLPEHFKVEWPETNPLKLKVEQDGE